MRLRFAFMILMVGGSLLAGPVLSRARLTAGAGMAYEVSKLTVVDQSDRYFHTVLQSTLAMANIAYEQPLFDLQLQGGWSDWNVSGDWQGTNVSKISTDVLGWLAQQQMTFKAVLKPWTSFYLGAQVEDSRQRHYSGQDNVTYLTLHSQLWELLAGYEWFHFQGLYLSSEVGFAPMGRLWVAQDTHIPPQEFVLHQYRENSRFNRWRASIAMNYDDSEGWRLALRYTLDYSQAQQLEELQSLSWRHGQLLGLFMLSF